MKQSSLVPIIRRNLLIFVLIVVVVSGVGLLASRKSATSYFGSMAVSVKTQRAVTAPSSQLILEPSVAEDLRIAVATTQSWVSDPAVVTAALDSANISSSDLSLKSLRSVFTVTPEVTPGGSTYKVEYSSPSDGQTKAALYGLQQAMLNVANQYNADASDLASIKMLFGDYTVSSVSPTVPLTPFAGLGAGIILALVTVALLERKRV